MKKEKARGEMMETQVEKEEVEIDNKIDPKKIQEIFESNGWELESVRLENNEKMTAVFIRKNK